MSSLKSFKNFLKCNPYLQIKCFLCNIYYTFFLLKICSWNPLLQYHFQILQYIWLYLIPLSFLRVLKENDISVSKTLKQNKKIIKSWRLFGLNSLYYLCNDQVISNQSITLTKFFSYDLRWMYSFF